MKHPENIVKDLLIAKSFAKRFSFVSVGEETWHPLADVYETSREIIVKMELPGVDPAEIRIFIEKGRLIVQGVRKDLCRHDKVSYHQMEIIYGPFQRIILLPLSTKFKEAKAKYDKGLLEIRLPNAEEHSPGSVTVTIE